MRNANCCLSFWFPMLKATGVPVPKTEIISLNQGLWFNDGSEEMEDPGEAEARRKNIDDLCSMIGFAAEGLGGYPVFLRTGQTSGKHSWVNTCFLSDPLKIRDHVYEIWEYSECADIIGLDTSVWAVREMLKTSAPFTAFNGFPVTKERRYFFKDGAVCGFHPYWPPVAVEEHVGFKDWRAELDKLNFQSSEEMKELHDLTTKVAKAFPGAWSLDWLWTTDRGWVAIDMAEAHRSFIWREHPTAPKVEFEGAQI